MIRRRLYAEIRVSRLAIWSRRLATFAVPVFVLAVLLHRLGAVDYYTGIVLVMAALLILALAFVLAAAALVVIWNEGLKGLGSAMFALVLSAALLAYPAFEILRGVMLPAINDVSTDTADPPHFQAIAKLRPRNANPVQFPGTLSAELQKKFYPAVRSVEFDADLPEIVSTVIALMQQNRWRNLDNVQSSADRDVNLEAVASTAIMGFREDIAIRIRRMGNIVRVDMRSASRYGQRDFGTNARRIENFLAQLTEARRRARP
jgi:hypothetical protein